MKKLLSIFLILCFSLVGFSQNKGYEIKLKVNGMKDSTCYLINYFGTQRYYKDTAQFNSKGVAIFKGQEPHHGGIYTLYTGGKILFEFIINDEPLIDLETDTSGYIEHMKVNKSKENEVFFENIKFIGTKQKESEPYRKKLSAEGTSKKEKKELNQKMAEIGEDINKHRLNIIDKYPDLFVSVIFKTMRETKIPSFAEITTDSIRKLKRYQYAKNHFFDDVDFSDPRINYTPLYQNKLDKYFKTLVYPTPDSIIKGVDYVLGKAKANGEIFQYTVQTLFNKYVKSKIMGMDAVYAHIGEKYYTHEVAFWADSTQIEKIQDQSRKLKPLLLGKKAINLSLLDTSGNNWINMHQVKAEYLVLIFWDPECGHCKKELPKLVHYVDSIKKTVDVKVYSVSSDHNVAWKKFVRGNNLNFINVAVPQEVYKDQQKATELIIKGITDLKSLNYHATYDIFSTPQVYLLDKNKIIIGKKLDTALLKQVIEKEEARKNK